MTSLDYGKFPTLGVQLSGLAVPAIGLVATARKILQVGGVRSGLTASRSRTQPELDEAVGLTGGIPVGLAASEWIGGIPKQNTARTGRSSGVDWRHPGWIGGIPSGLAASRMDWRRPEWIGGIPSGLAASRVGWRHPEWIGGTRSSAQPELDEALLETVVDGRGCGGLNGANRTCGHGREDPATVACGDGSVHDFPTIGLGQTRQGHAQPCTSDLHVQNGTNWMEAPTTDLGCLQPDDAAVDATQRRQEPDTWLRPNADAMMPKKPHQRFAHQQLDSEAAPRGPKWTSGRRPQATEPQRLRLHCGLHRPHIAGRQESDAAIARHDPKWRGERHTVVKRTMGCGARGTRRMENILNGEEGRNTRALVLLDVAYVPRFHTNIVSARRLARKGLWHCGVDNTLRLGTYEDNDILCRLIDHYDLDVVEYKPISRSCFTLPQSPISVFNAFQDVFSPYRVDSDKPKRQRVVISRVTLPLRQDTAELWHLRACHAGPQALEQLVLQTKGVRIKGPTTVQCTACGTGKATEIISRRESRNRSRQPFYRIFIDIFEFPAAYNTHRYVLLATDEFSGMMFSWSMASKAEVSRIIKNFEARIKRHTGASICKIRIDSERTIINLPYQKHSEFQVWAAEAGIDIELPPSHTKEPTGGAERPGGINQERMRCMTGRLPQELWPEFYRAAVWIHNILPSRRNAWISPKEKMDRWFHQHFRWYRPPNVDFDATKDLRPEWHGIHAYGCKAYPLNSRYKAGKDINQFKLGPRAHVGYLVGYQASNIYQEFFDPEKEEQLETEPVVEYRPAPQALEPLPQRGWDTILDEFLYEFDEHILGFSPDGSNSGVEDAIGAATGTADDASQPIQPLSQRLLTPLGEPSTLPTPDPTPQLARRDASPASGSTGSDTPTPDTPLRTGSSSPAQRSLAASDNEHDEPHGTDPSSSRHRALPDPSRSADSRPQAHDASNAIQSSTASRDHSPVEITLDTIVVKPLITRRRSSSDGDSMHPDTQPSSDLQPYAARGATRTRRSQRELYGDQPTRKSSRAPKPIRKLGDDAHSVFTSQLPANQHPEGSLTTFHSIFLAAVSKAARDHTLHRDDLVRLPKRYQDLNKHPMSTEFKEAMRSELRNLLQRGTWRLIEREKARAPPLPLKWVYNYKFDQDGYLQRCKARICVRGDLQEDDDGLETYAATLAAKTFRVIMATAARFDLGIRQFDVGNAFLYSDLKKDRPVYVQLPKGYVDLGFLKPGETPTMVAELEKALYALKAAGIDRTDEEPCVFTNGKVLVLVYVDDILILGPRQEKGAIDDLVRHLQFKYDLREEEFQWYLGIRVVRVDRTGESTSAKTLPSIPITTVPLTRHDGQASEDEIKMYQERIGSLMYVAVMTRPDIARTTAQLARFLTNPSPLHLAAANQCIRYLYTTRYLAIVYDGLHTGEALVIASDASFADDIESRRSSQGYVMMLFNGPVAWKAGLQDTVTTSTTEAEILSLERTTKDCYALDRLLRDISLDLGPLKHVNANVLLNAKRKWKSGDDGPESDGDGDPNAKLSSRDMEAVLAAERQEGAPGQSNVNTPVSHNYRGVLELWKFVAFAETKEEHEKAWVRLCDEFNDQQAFLMYLYKTYLPIRAQWAQCFIKKYRNFGVRVTSGTEASNNNVKSYLLNGMSHLHSLVEAIEAMLSDQE
ncbi:hypothetical protein Purlil1_12083 [Purpureocillium lilacinum]|uniref:Integrase catalytic domain-containing protein n=1 Tax=Purpureocillium lilacinum TaxID=33203 RepID=A0ABR0BHZ4_PURLI|nr:hypothetical protein Purlil1_12083 [Purpureocillium lilacinum]